jgi:hypothetical protein
LLVDLPIRHHPHVADIIADLVETGIALIAGITDASALTVLAQSIGRVIPHPDSGPDGVTVIEDRGERTAALAGL